MKVSEDPVVLLLGLLEELLVAQIVVWGRGPQFFSKVLPTRPLLKILLPFVHMGLSSQTTAKVVLMLFAPKLAGCRSASPSRRRPAWRWAARRRKLKSAAMTTQKKT